MAPSGEPSLMQRASRGATAGLMNVRKLRWFRVHGQDCNCRWRQVSLHASHVCACHTRVARTTHKAKKCVGAISRPFIIVHSSSVLWLGRHANGVEFIGEKDHL